MRVIALNGSPNKDGNTSIMINRVFAEIEKEGIQTEMVQVGGRRISGCRACFKCFANKDGRCSIDNDILNECIEKMTVADGIILGSPTYFSNVTAEMKALIDRAGLVATANDYPFKRKVGAAVVAVRRAGATNVFDAINKFFLYHQMIVPGSSYWNLGLGMGKGEVSDDNEGMNTMKVLGENIAWTLTRINA
jgi:multimeric flavodoxin WrbA